MDKIRVFKSISKVLNAILFFSSLLILIGWVSGLPWFRNIFSGFIPMKPNSALCFMLASLTLWLLQRQDAGKKLNYPVFYFSIFMIFLISFSVLCEYLFNFNSTIDLFLVQNHNRNLAMNYPIRMALNSSVNFILISVALAIFNFKKIIFSYISQLLALLVVLLSLFTFVCYLYGAKEPAVDFIFGSCMAFQSALAFLFFVLSYLFLKPDKAIMENISSEFFGSFILRRILPVVMTVPLILGFLKVRAEKINLLPNAMGVALMAVLNSLTISLFVYFLAFYLNRLDQRRKTAEAVVYETKVQLQEKSELLTQNLEEMSKSREIMISMLEDNNTIRANLEKSLEELKETQDLMLQAGKLKAIGELASGVAHEVKNPLGIILQGLAYLEKNVLGRDEDSSEVVSMMKDGIERANKIVDGLLDFSKVSKLDLLPEHINIIIESSITLVQLDSRFSGMQIKRELAEGITKVMVDKNMMEQVFINLLINAAQSMNYVGVITVRSYMLKLEQDKQSITDPEKIVFKSGEKVAIVEIEDTGSGISDDNLKNIFVPFFSTKGPKGGAGLGLGICLNIINRHNATIEIKSQLNKGTKATLFLKILEE